MKTKFKFILSMLAAVLTINITSCSDSEEGTQAVTVKVKVDMPDGFKSDAVYANHEVYLGNYVATTDEAGVATFTGVIPDVYTISTSCEISAAEYDELANAKAQSENYILSATILNQTITAETTIFLSLEASSKQSLVISKVYYAGTKDLNDKNFHSAQYIELFNNSSETVKLAGTYLGMLESESTPAYLIGKTPDYIYLKQIFRFPNTGKTELLPGESVVVTNSAFNFVENNDIDLSGADFEAKDNSGKLRENPDVPDMELIYTAYQGKSEISIINFLTGGSCSLVIFNTDENVENWEKVYADGKSKGNQFVMAPVKYVIDGVEILKYKTTGVDVSTKRLYDFIDAGYININSVNGHNAEVVYRKIAKKAGDRVILSDTNNSSNDFVVSDEIKPREYK